MCEVPVITKPSPIGDPLGGGKRRGAAQPVHASLRDGREAVSAKIPLTARLVAGRGRGAAAGRHGAAAGARAAVGTDPAASPAVPGSPKSRPARRRDMGVLERLGT